MLDRLAQLVPGWTERNPADPLVTVVEALAHTADRMSYRQDAAATEAYLGTARSRISVRRHARLLDYRVHEGCTARTWLHLAVTANSPVETEGLDADETLVVTGGVEHATVDADQLRDLLAGGAVTFTLLDRIQPLHARNEVTIYTWGGVACTLPAGATRATLVDADPLGLVAGDYLLLEQVRSPQTGRANDADPTLRHVVRLVEVEPSVDPVEGNLKLLEVTWAGRRRPPLRPPSSPPRSPVAGWATPPLRGGPRQPRARPPRDDRTRRRPHGARPPAMAPGGQRGPDRLGAALPARRRGRRAAAPGPRSAWM